MCLNFPTFLDLSKNQKNSIFFSSFFTPIFKTLCLKNRKNPWSYNSFCQPISRLCLSSQIRNGKFNKTTTIPACGYFHTRQAKVRNHPYESHLKIKIDQKNTSRLSTKHPSSITTTVKATKCSSRANANNSKLQLQICTGCTLRHN